MERAAQLFLAMLHSHHSIYTRGLARKTAIKPARRSTANGGGDDPPFWRVKRMSEMTPKEWESLCDGCGRCCLNKLGEYEICKTRFTHIGSRSLDCEAGRCRALNNNKKKPTTVRGSIAF